MKHAFKVGDFVQSTFRAQWKGTIVETFQHDKHMTAWVRQEIDRHGRPMRKQKVMCLDVNWLRKLERTA